MISVSNRWQSEMRSPADGSQPLTAGFGTLITASATLHTKGAWADCVLAADWTGFVGDAFEIEININTVNVSAANVKMLVDIGVDSGGGYSSIIDNLLGTEASAWSALGTGVSYCFRLRVPTGVKIGARCQSNTVSATGNVTVILRGNPSNVGAIQAGTFVRTLGANTATSGGTAVPAGTVAEGAWTAIATLADDVWHWEVGYDNADAAVNAGSMLVDLGVGAASAEVAFARGWAFGKGTTEAVSKSAFDQVWAIASGQIISARMQVVGSETSEGVVVYAVGGSYELPNAANATGTVTISGSPAANGMTVEIFARDTDGVVELIGSTTTSGGAGGFSLGCPDTTRSYHARYVDGATVGCSIAGTPGVTALNITIGGAGGGPPPSNNGPHFAQDGVLRVPG